MKRILKRAKELNEILKVDRRQQTAGTNVADDDFFNDCRAALLTDVVRPYLLGLNKVDPFSSERGLSKTEKQEKALVDYRESLEAGFEDGF